MRWLSFVIVVGCSYHPPTDTPDAPAGGGLSAPVDSDLPADQRCTARYGAIDSYQLCVATEASCTFYAQTNGGDCKTACEAAGYTCIESRDGDCVDTNHSTQACTDQHADQVCVCAN